MPEHERHLIKGFGTLVLDMPDPYLNDLVSKMTTPYKHMPRQFSVTTLIAPTQQVQMKRKRWAEVEVLASSLLPRVLGSLVHARLDEITVPFYHTEQRVKIEREVDGEAAWMSGYLDRVLYLDSAKVAITDFKVGTNAGAMMDPKPEYVAQANLYAHAYREMHDVEIASLHLSYWCKNWQPGGWGKQPKIGNVIQDVPVWGKDQCETYMMERLRLHLTAEATAPDPCTVEETWREEHWAAMKKGRKTAVKRFWKDANEAALWIEDQKDSHLLSIEHRPGEPRRCMNYCDVSGICSQYQESK